MDGCRLKLGLWCLLGWLSGSCLWGQTTFVVERVPARTPAQDTLYVTGSFNDWRPGDPAYQMHRRPDGAYTLTLGALYPPFTYKFTRGSWATVEADKVGKPVDNRTQVSGVAPLTIAVHIEGWEDLPGLVVRDSLRLQLDRLPPNTPEDARLFVTGSFNSWQPGDPAYRLRPQAEGHWTVAVPVFGDTVEYKYTRGSWATVEGRKSGRARFNRRWIAGQPLQRVEEVASWEDLSGTVINAYTVFWLMAAILGLLIVLGINTIEPPVPPANRLLSLLLLLFAAALLARVVVYDRDIFQWQPKLLLVPDLLYFLYAPLFVMYIQRLLRTTPLVWDWRRWLTFLPVVLHLLALAPAWLLDNETFRYKAVDQSLRPGLMLIGGVALLYNIGYWLYARRLIYAYEHESEHRFSSGSNLTFLRTIMWLKAGCLLLWAGIYSLGAWGYLQEQVVTPHTDRGTDLLWIGLSMTVFLLGYFAIREPDIFRLPESEAEADLLPAPKLPDPDDDDASPASEPAFDPALKKRLSDLMAQEAPYLNPGLTLSDLAALAGTNTHDLSRVINQGFGVNFNDFVNTYRVEAFKQRLADPTYRNHTLLAVAFMAGFNSKTAFNRSFKKLTGQTPGEYYRGQEGAASS